jgi:hypothetical protein
VWGVDATTAGPFVVQGGAVAGLLLAVRWVLKGKIVPSATVDQMRADLTVWRETSTSVFATAEAAIRANQTLTEQVARLVTTTHQLVDQNDRLLNALLGPRSTSQAPLPAGRPEPSST